MARMTESERAELIRARDDLERQLGLVQNPLRPIDRNPQLEAKLRAMLAEIDDLLADEVSDPTSVPPSTS
jgi:hypothetical protein